MNELETKQYIIINIIARVIAFPFFVGLAFTGSLIMFTKWVINYIRYGGEAIAYTEKMNRKSIQDVYVKLMEKENL